MRILNLLIVLFLCASPVQAQIKRHFDGFTGTIVVYDRQNDSFTIHNEKRAATRYTPFSTFKIPNSLIALETGVVPDVETELVWDKVSYPQEDWWPSSWLKTHNLRTAITYSVVPLYRDIARKIGDERMSAYLKQFDYGNQDISSGLDEFWLNGSIKISAREQILFLRKFHEGRLGLSERTTSLVKDILLQEKTDNYTLYAKTGGGSLTDEKALGWYTGFVERKEGIYFFAMNIEGATFQEVLAPRIEITKKVLKELYIIE